MSTVLPKFIHHLATIDVQLVDGKLTLPTEADIKNWNGGAPYSDATVTYEFNLYSWVAADKDGNVITKVVGDETVPVEFPVAGKTEIDVSAVEGIAKVYAKYSTGIQVGNVNNDKNGVDMNDISALKTWSYVDQTEISSIGEPIYVGSDIKIGNVNNDENGVDMNDISALKTWSYVDQTENPNIGKYIYLMNQQKTNQATAEKTAFVVAVYSTIK